MNPLFSKETRFHRSISAKLNPEEQKLKLLKPVNESLEYCRQFNPRTKLIDNPSTQSLLDIKIQENIDQFIKSNTINAYSKRSSLSARQQLKIKFNPCNPFESLTQSSIKRNPENREAMELILAHRKITQLQSKINALTKELNQRFTQNQIKFTSIKQELTQVNIDRNMLQAKNHQLQSDLAELQKENIKLRTQIEKSKNNSDQNNSTLIDHNQKDAQKFKILGHQFQRKINDLYDQNYKLKNKVSWLQGKLQENQTHLSSLKSLNDLLEKRFSEQQSNTLKQQLHKENQQLRLSNLQLKQEKQTIRSQHQIEILKLENQIAEIKSELKSINYTSKDEEGINKVRNANNCGQPNNRKIMRLEYQVESLQFALKDQIGQILRLKQKNKKFAKMLSLGNI